MASTPSSRTYLLNFSILPVFVVVLIVIRLIVISYWLPMHDQHKCTPMRASLSVFIDFRWKLLKLMAVKILKNNFSNFFWSLTNLKLFRELLASVSIDRSHLLSTATKIICLAILSSNYWLYDFNDKRFQKILKNFGYFCIMGYFWNLIALSKYLYLLLAQRERSVHHR